MKQSSISFLGLLTLIFVIAKIWNQIDWAWVWVFSPLWIPTAVMISFFIGVGACCLVLYILAQMLDALDLRRRWRRLRKRTRRTTEKL